MIAIELEGNTDLNVFIIRILQPFANVEAYFSCSEFCVYMYSGAIACVVNIVTRS